MPNTQPIETKSAATVDYIAELIRIIPDVLWVALIVWAICYLYPRIKRDILPRLRTLKGFGVEAEFIGEKLADAIRIKGVDVPYEDRRGLMRRIAMVPSIWPNARILWADDRPASLAAERALFEALGASVSVVTTSAEALAFLARSAVDVILSDMSREGKADEGALFAERVWSSGGRAPLIIYTGESQEGRPMPAYVFGITNRPDELVQLVMDALERRRG